MDDDSRARLRLGDKLIVGTTTLHYVCGRLMALDGAYAVFAVGAQRVRVPLAHIETVLPASEAQAEFAK
jgi:hypothetical protein